MSLKEQYLVKNKKRFKQFIFLYSVLVISFVIYLTFASYNASSEGNVKISLADWVIAVNGKDINEENMLSDLIVLKKDDGSTKIDAGDEGYFDIEIDPSGTEVSVEYKIVLDLDNSMLPDGFAIHSFSLDGGLNKKEFSTDNKIAGAILLEDKNILTDNDKLLIRYYWKWEGENDDIDSYTIHVNAEIKQYMGFMSEPITNSFYTYSYILPTSGTQALRIYQNGHAISASVYVFTGGINDAIPGEVGPTKYVTISTSNRDLSSRPKLYFAFKNAPGERIEMTYR